MAECKWRKTCEYDSDGLCVHCFRPKPQEARLVLRLDEPLPRLQATYNTRTGMALDAFSATLLGPGAVHSSVCPEILPEGVYGLQEPILLERGSEVYTWSHALQTGILTLMDSQLKTAIP